MRKADRRRRRLVVSFLLLSGGLAGPVMAQPPAAAQPPAPGPASGSSDPALELARLMSAQQLDSVAAKDTEGVDRFVAALGFPGQLLVVSARYEVPLYVNEKIANKDYREVYIDLNTASIAGTKFLVTDSGADGLSADGAVVDVVDTGSGVLRLDGDWGGQSMSEAEYRDAFADVDRQYTRMLRALIAQIQ